VALAPKDPQPGLRGAGSFSRATPGMRRQIADLDGKERIAGLGADNPSLMEAPGERS